MPQIKQFNIDQSKMPKSKTKRQYNITGDVNSKYILQVVNSDNKFYNFKSKTFTNVFTPESFLKKTMSSTSETDFILFPSVSGNITYDIILIASPENNTFFSNSVTGGGDHVISKRIEQQGNVTLTLHLDTASTANYGDPTTPANLEDPPAADITAEAPPSHSGKVILDTSYVVYNRKTSGEGYGLRLTRQPLDTDWYYQETEVIITNPAGDGVSNNVVIVSDLTGLITGMELVYHKGTTAPSSTTTITNINTATRTITFSSSSAFEHGETMTFRAYGSSAISEAIGGSIVFGPGKAAMLSLTKTVKSGATSANITITDTYGISGGGHVTVTGVGINNATTNNINTVTEDVDGGGSPDGVIAMDNSSTVTTGTLLTFTGSATQIKIAFGASITTFPSVNKTIYLNLDNFITPGAAS
jgi:hypothetical protein